MLKHFEGIFREVRNYIQSEGYKQVEVIGKNPKLSDVSTQFDLGAEKVAVDYCRKHGLPVKILSEESGEIDLSNGTPEYVFIIDPVDGSTNLKKGIEGTALCISVIPYKGKGKMNPSDVRYAFIGSLISGAFCEGEKDGSVLYKGPFDDTARIIDHGSLNEDLEYACVEIDMDFALDESSSELNENEGAKIQRVLPLIYPVRKIKHIRRNGSAGIGLMEVPIGSIDAYLDARDISTPENWIGAYMLIKGVGGEFTDLQGNEISEVDDLKTPYSYLATGNPVLHEKILNELYLEK
jgi:myo-inositol-1(or 4)-monophosphatase